jgi:hypothetical protein
MRSLFRSDALQMSLRSVNHLVFKCRSAFIYRIFWWPISSGTGEEKASSIVTGGTPTKAAMRRILVVLTGMMLCAATLHSDPALPRQGEEMSAAVTDMPGTIDMSYADPKTWHRLPPAARVSDQVPAQALDLPIRFSSRPRPF